MQSGALSRFNVDQRISREKFECLYKTWIQKSVEKSIADVVFISQKNGKITGMITVEKKGDCGNIGLVSVDKSVRKKNIGVNLVRTAQAWFISKGLRIGRVITQEDNIAGCKLYEKCDFYVEKIDYFYHFWL